MVSELHSMYEQMGVVRKGLVGSGNGIRKNMYLADIAQNKFSLELKMPNHNEEAAVGAALFAGVSARIFENTEAT